MFSLVGEVKRKKTAVCKPGSVEFRHLSRPPVTERLHQPTLRVGRATLKPRFIWFFNPWGLPSPASLRGVVSSYLAFSPLPASRRYLFCGTFRHPCGCLPVRKHGALCCPDFPLPIAGQRRNHCCFYRSVKTYCIMLAPIFNAFWWVASLSWWTAVSSQPSPKSHSYVKRQTSLPCHIRPNAWGGFPSCS